MTRIAFLFPGQGSHVAGMASAWASHPAHRTFDEVGRATGLDLAILADDPTACAATAVAQPALFAASLTAWRALSDAGVTPVVVAGHSLGEVTATVAAGSLTVRDGARLVAERGQAMGRASRANPGGMAAVLALGEPEAAALRDVLTATGRARVTVANDNARGQLVLSGPADELAQAVEAARELGGRIRALDVEGAFHSPAMTPAVVAVARVLQQVPVHDPVVPLLSATSGAPVTDGAAVARALSDGVLATVRWRAVQERLVDQGIDTAIEVGPGGVLRGLARRAMPEVTTHAASSPDEVAGLSAALDPTAITAAATT